MGLKVIGAGLGRTGTTSLRDALSILLDGPCYHFEEVISKAEHVPLWEAAIRGEKPRWEEIYGGYVATTDWPGAAFWADLYDAYPGAIVLLSQRRSSDEWFDSVESTIEPLLTRSSRAPEDGWHLMAQELLRERFVPAPFEKNRAVEAYERHNEHVRATVPADRLIEWAPGDGWEPLCSGLCLPAPVEPFPHLNTTQEFRSSLAAADERNGVGGRTDRRRPSPRSMLRKLKGSR